VSATEHHTSPARRTGGPPAVLVVDGHGVVTACTPGAADLAARPPGTLAGRPLDDLLGPGPDGTATLRRAGAAPLPVRADTVPLAGGDGARLVLLTPRDEARRAEEDRAVLRALFAQTRVGVAVHDPGLLLRRVNEAPAAPPGTAGGGVHRFPLPLADIVVPADAGPILDRLAHVVRAGEPLAYWEHSARLRAAPEQERVLAFTALRLAGDDDGPLGVLSLFTDITEQHQARRRMALLHAAAERVGVSLDVTRNAEELAAILVPDFADLAAVDLVHAVLAGEDAGERMLGAPVRRVAVAGGEDRRPAAVLPAGADFRCQWAGGAPAPAATPLLGPVVASLRPEPLPGAGTLPAPSLLPGAPGSPMVVPLTARGRTLGALVLWRSAGRSAFTAHDAGLAEEIASRAALGMDNARRYTREHRTVVALQRSLLPRPVTEFTATEAAGSYIPAGTAAGTGGSWYDVIPLSSARVAFVIGDVAGHGLGATATMGRLRTAVQTLADLDLPPDELLTRLDDLAIRLAGAGPGPGPGPVPVDGSAVGATCLYCVWDPVAGRCAMAGAGRLPPVLARPGRPAETVPLRSGPPLGVGGSPFEAVQLDLEPGSVLVLFTDELVSPADREPPGGSGDPDARTARLLDTVSARAAAGDPPAATGQAVLDALLADTTPADDVALLVARVRRLPDDATAHWEFPADPAVVGEARDHVTRRLTEWGLADVAFATELIVSELVTNAIRYAGGPVGLRLIRDETLVCEVWDPSETQPHLRRARPTDEGGRGLFLVAQLARRWGSRYTANGKVIWTEQPLTAT
jgi:serine phosphatase RsbU (regulator of sigma subunit)/PAS domain-containing protein/anti-sigma regulatory factor (Ser/Thr protein kinase)